MAFIVERKVPIIDLTSQFKLIYQGLLRYGLSSFWEAFLSSWTRPEMYHEELQGQTLNHILVGNARIPAVPCRTMASPSNPTVCLQSMLWEWLLRNTITWQPPRILSGCFEKSYCSLRDQVGSSPLTGTGLWATTTCLINDPAGRSWKSWAGGD